MFKFVTLYRRVDDEAALEKFFSEVQLPLSEKLTGLLRSQVSRITGKPGGQSRFHLAYELYFSSEADFQQALLTETGIKLLQALTPWAQAGIISWFYAQVYEEEAGQRDDID